jgi:hypothetical protein
MLHHEPGVPDGVGDTLGGVVLLEGGLRIGVDGVGQRDELFPARLDRLADPSLERCGVDGGGPIGGLGHGCLEGAMASEP